MKKRYYIFCYIVLFISLIIISIGFAMVLLNSIGVLMAFRPLNLGNPKPIIRILEPFRMILRLGSF